MYGRTDRLYEHMTGFGHLHLKGYFPSCKKAKNFSYTKQQIEIEGEGSRVF